MREDRPDLFEFSALAARRDRALRLGFAGGADFLWREVAGLVAERLALVVRECPRVAVVGTGAGVIAGALGQRAEIAQFDPSPLMAQAAGAAVLEGETLPLAPRGA